MWAGVGQIVHCMRRIGSATLDGLRCHFFFSASCLHFSDLPGSLRRRNKRRQPGGPGCSSPSMENSLHTIFVTSNSDRIELIHLGGELAPCARKFSHATTVNTLDCRSRPKGPFWLIFLPGQLLHASYPIVDFVFLPLLLYGVGLGTI